MSKEWASMISVFTALMVKTLSKRAQLLSASIQTQAMFSSPPHWVNGLRFKKGTFWDVFRLWEPCLGMPVEWLLVSEGSGLFSLLSPLLYLNSLFGWSCRDPSDNPLQDGQGYHNQSNFVLFSLVQHDYIDKTDDTQLTDLLHQSHSRCLCPLHLRTQPLLPPLPSYLSLLHLCYFPLYLIGW